MKSGSSFSTLWTGTAAVAESWGQEEQQHPKAGRESTPAGLLRLGIPPCPTGWASSMSVLEADWFSDMPGRRRGPSRQQLRRSALPSLQTLVGGSCGNRTSLRNRNGNAIGLPVPPITALITPGPVRHCQIPDLPVDGSLLFEFLFFIYLLVALLIQYINIYKTVWWYPYNHPASCTSLVSFSRFLNSCYSSKKLIGNPLCRNESFFFL